MLVSIFNDVVGPVMRGASSSHCAAALRIGRIARDLMGGEIESVEVQFDTGGSLPATHESQGSDMGLFGGLLGWDADDDRLPDSGKHLEQSGIELNFEYADLSDPHPNTYRLTMHGGGRSRRLVAISTGGGMIEVQQIDDFPVSIGGDFDETLVWLNGPLSLSDSARRDMESRFELDELVVHQRDDQTMLQLRSSECVDGDDVAAMMQSAEVTDVAHLRAVLPVRSRKALTVPFQTCSDMLAAAENDTPLWKMAVEYESARSGLSDSELVAKMADIVRILRKSIESGLSGTEYADRVLGFQSGGYAKALEDGRLIDSRPSVQYELIFTNQLDIVHTISVGQTLKAAAIKTHPTKVLVIRILPLN